MKVKEEYLLDSEGRRRLFNIYTCDICETGYKKQKRLAVNSKYEHFCSRTCGVKANIDNNYISIVCANCGTTFSRLKSKLSNSKHGIHFCSRDCKDAGQSYIELIKPEHYGTGDSSYRQKALQALPNVCYCCGYNNTYALEVHHVDKDRTNNKLDNLLILCANCHTLVHKDKLQLLGC